MLLSASGWELISYSSSWLHPVVHYCPGTAFPLFSSFHFIFISALIMDHRWLNLLSLFCCFHRGAVGIISLCGVSAAIRIACDLFTPPARLRQTAKPDLSLFIGFVFLVIMIQCHFQRHTVTVCAAAAKRLSVFIGSLCERQSCGDITAYYEPSVRWPWQDQPY